MQPACRHGCLQAAALRRGLQSPARPHCRHPQRGTGADAWRIEGTLREFPKFPPINLWFEFPVHRLDGNGALQDINPDEAAPAWQRGAKARKGKAKQAKQSKKEAFDTAYNALCLGGDAPTVQDVIEYYTEQNEDGEVQKPTSRTVYRWIKDYGYSLDKNSGKILNDTTCDMT